nr:glucosyl hydrolase [Rhizobium sp. Q54]
MNRWRKLGRLFVPSGGHPKLLSHAANPLPVHLEGDVYRVFFSGRDAQNRSSVGAVDINVEKRAVVAEHEAPVIAHGQKGSFYEAGISIGNCYTVGSQRYMLFMGWQNPPGGHWRGDIGRLRVTPSLGLELDMSVPLMGVDNVDPLSLSYPWVEQRTDGGFDMWYGSTEIWDAGNGEMLHIIKAAESADGHVWRRKGPAVPHEIGLAQAFSRPTVLSEGDRRHMWFSYRSGLGESYRIGYAVSEEGARWELRLGEAGIDVSIDGWDCEMIEYPFVFEHRDRRYMLYNGNGFGKTGFGLAVYD